jgi:hypothetical protein
MPHRSCSSSPPIDCVRCQQCYQFVQLLFFLQPQIQVLVLRVLAVTKLVAEEYSLDDLFLEYYQHDENHQ